MSYPSEKVPKSALDEFDRKSTILEERLKDPDFLANRGLGNEVGIHIFAYNARLELLARELTEKLVRYDRDHTGVLPCRIVEHNLYDEMIGILREEDVLDALPRQEERRGKDRVLRSVQKNASPEAVARRIGEAPREADDVILITGVGEAYPFVRLHTVLDNLQVYCAETPVVALYPGAFTGRSFSLFNKLDDGNYYRAFSLV